jgi:hypothetical protein
MTVARPWRGSAAVARMMRGLVWSRRLPTAGRPS